MTVQFRNLIVRGLFANRPAPSREGILYFATDTESVYRDTGSSWELVLEGDSDVSWSEISEKPTEFDPSDHDANKVTSGTFDNARISESSVTQHESALSIDWSQIVNEPSVFPPDTHSHGSDEINYNNTTSGLTATDVQAAIDELAASGGGGSGSSLYAEIIADSPFVYFPCNETSGSTLADAIGSDDCTMVSGTISWSELLPNEDEKYPAFFSSNGRAESASSTGAPKPLNGDLTVECVFAPLGTISGGDYRFFTLSGPNTGAEPDNTQFSIGITSTNNFVMAWQTGGNVTAQTSSASAYIGKFEPRQRTHFVAVRDATANTVDFYINGCFVGQASYASVEATGGSNAIYRIGRDQFSQGSNCVIGHCAAYSTKLSAARIREHAKAAGLYAR